MPERRILVVGLGEVAKTHLAVLADLDEVSVVGGVDPEPRPDIRFRDRPLPTYPSVVAARDSAPTMVVVATPTSTHTAVCDEATAVFPAAEILVEKPLADNLSDARRLLRLPGLRVAYHLRFAPEVEWGVLAAAALGPVVSARSVFTDPYESALDTVTVRLGTSWLDSGINALSVLDRFSHLTGRRSLRELRRSAFEGRFAFEGGQALVVTSWYVTDAAKTTTITYASGATLVLDHTAVAGYLLEHGAVTSMFGTDGSTDRRYSHYQALYRELLTDQQRDPALDLHLHELLLPT
ncbi:MAG TPA: Gfo/Idh/MocA family oxidoreductase [Pseudonocardiaceae bacterium]|nr:Gfo/Idh/MocA family oxidoreductase [Pseudonocardiaceae bacterium]